MKPKYRSLLKIALRSCYGLLFCGMASLLAIAQTQSITPQSVNQLIFNAQTAAAASPNSVTPGGPATVCFSANFAPCPIPNLGQIYHIVHYTTTGTPMFLDIRLEASQDGTNFFPISDDATDLTGGALFAVGNYPVIRLNLVALDNSGSMATVTASYSGTSTISSVPFGFYNSAQHLRSLLWIGKTAGAVQGATIGDPFGSSAGFLVVSCTSGATLPAGSSLQVSAVVANVGQSIANFNLGTGCFQVFQIPDYPTAVVQIAYSEGGASASVFQAFYYFYSPGQNVPNYAAHITTGTNTQALIGVNHALFLHTLNVNTAGTGSTATIFDAGTSNCSTPVSTLAVIDTTAKATYTFDTFVTTGICITTVGTADLTVSYR
jgi:hypothetical protein